MLKLMLMMLGGNEGDGRRVLSERECVEDGVGVEVGTGVEAGVEIGKGITIETGIGITEEEILFIIAIDDDNKFSCLH